MYLTPELSTTYVKLMVIHLCFQYPGMILPWVYPALSKHCLRNSCEEVCCGSSAVIWVVDEVATHGDTCPKLVLLCITVRAYYLVVGEVAPAFFGDLCFVDKKDGFCGGCKEYNFLAE
jgi:hypothetical protein